MCSFRGWVGVWAAVIAAALCGPARASIVLYSGMDPGVGPGQPRPNSDASAALFDSNTLSLGPVQKITFEGPSFVLGTPTVDNSAITIGTGITLATQGTDHTVVPGFPFGVSNNSPAPLTDGYNTTPGGSQFFLFAPSINATTASVTLNFTVPATGFGAYFTGLGTAAGSVAIKFNDGTPESITIPGMSQGGVQFFGFTDAGLRFTSLQIQMTGFSSTSRDVFGIDDVRVVAVPEPSSLLQLGLGLAGLGGPLLVYAVRLRRPAVLKRHYGGPLECS